MINLGLNGACGRMGRTNAEAIMEDEETQLVYAIEKKGAKELGSDIGVLSGCGEAGVLVKDVIEEGLSASDVIIDFSTPESTLEALKHNMEYKKGFVIGTTGFSKEGLEELTGYGKYFGIVFSPNFSIGVNVLFKMTELVAGILNKAKDYDLEIYEAHHRYKKDSPSGTALKLAELGAKYSGRDIEKDMVCGRKGLIGERGLDEIGMFSMRAGDIIGEHTLSFCTEGERVELTHKAHNRKTFSKGAILASKWLYGKGRGFFSMREVLGL